MTASKGFPIFVINLERSLERRHFMQTQFDELGLEVEFFAAVDGATAEPNVLNRCDQAKAMRVRGCPLSPAEIGCFASHYKLWEQCVALNTPIVIMEDDVRLDPAFPDALQLAAREIGRLKFLRLSAMFRRRYQTLSVFDERHSLIRYLKGPYGMQCYALSAEGAATLLLHAQVWVEAVDAYVDSFWKHGLASLALYPFTAISDQTIARQSTIGADRFSKPHWNIALRHNLVRFVARFRRYAFNAIYPLQASARSRGYRS